MESAAALRSINCAVSQVQAMLEKPCVVSVCKPNLSLPSVSYIGGLAVGSKLFHCSTNRKGVLVSCAKASNGAGIAKSVDASGSSSQALGEINAMGKAAFSSGLEALLLEVCDETEVAELKVKVGDFEMHVKRNIGVATTAAPSSISPTTPPPIPSEPMYESAPAPPASSSPEASPSKNPLSEKSLKLAGLEASGASGYVLVSSPTVGTFHKGRTVKGKKRPPMCKQGDVIKQGQVIGYIYQFGSVLPVKSDAAGEVLRVLCQDGEAVGYGDPIVALLPSFPGINIM